MIPFIPQVQKGQIYRKQMSEFQKLEKKRGITSNGLGFLYKVMGMFWN